MRNTPDVNRDLTLEGSMHVSSLYRKGRWTAMDGDTSIVIQTDVLDDVLVVNAQYPDGVQMHITTTTDRVASVLGGSTPLHFQQARDFLHRIVLSEED